MDGGDWLCPREHQHRSPPPSAPLPPHQLAAASFVRALGAGINIMSSNIRWAQLTRADYAGLANRVGHVRLCGDFVETLIDWTSCPGRNWQPQHGAAGMSETDVQSAYRERLMADPAFGMYKAAAAQLLAFGIRVVLNPLHKKWSATLDETLLRRFWTILADEFDSVSFPPSHLAFEMANEPGNFATWHVANRAADLIEGFVRLVAARQPTRVLIVPGEVGFPRCAPDGPSSAFEQSWMTLTSRRAGSGADALRRYATIGAPLIGTFHFYDPRTFTHWTGGPRAEWDVTTGGARIAAILDAVRAAVPTLPFYIGEFGLDLEPAAEWHRSDGEHADGAEWLRAVRAFAHDRGFAYALWTYHLSKQGLTSARDAFGRLREWDCSELAAVRAYSCHTNRPHLCACVASMLVYCTCCVFGRRRSISAEMAAWVIAVAFCPSPREMVSTGTTMTTTTRARVEMAGVMMPVATRAATMQQKS